MKKAIFLDRDGIINKFVPDLSKPEQFVLIDGVPEAINKVRKVGFLIIIVTNQPGIAKGICTFEMMEHIHEKMRHLLALQKASIDAIYMCPHHPKKGFKGEVPELKIDCECRKPKPGMIFWAIRDFDIDPKKSWMVGDEERDIIAGKKANIKTIFVQSSDSSPLPCKEKPAAVAGSLKEAIDYILEHE
jgi:D,D-heptose 1,7-bisphosphate phosphatase